MRRVTITLSALPAQLDLIDRAAAVLGKSRSDFVLDAACERSRSALLDQAHFRLDTRAFTRFTRMLDAPATGNAGFERLMKVKAPWDSGTP